MRVPCTVAKRGVPAVVAAFVLGIVVAACGREPSPPPPPGPVFTATDRIASIILKKAPDGSYIGFKAPVSDDPTSGGQELALSRGRDQIAHWILSPPNANVTLLVQMDKGNAPFAGPIDCRQKNHCQSAPLDKTLPTPPAEGTKYSYSIKVTDNKTGKELREDPIIRVDP